MDKAMLPYVMISLGSVFLGSVSQVMLKKSAMQKHDTVMGEYLNPMVIIAYAIFFCTTVLGVLAYKGIPVSLGPVLETTSYLYVTFFGVTIFQEKLTKQKTVALVLIISGIVLFSLS